ncbi:MAG: LLM class flavin-dependent oxidoreductase [Hyphomicrobiaceae bacterium]
MKVVLFHEGICPKGTTWTERLGEITDEVILAEELGFDAYAMSEHHFAKGEATISSPEVGLAYIAGRTSRIRLRAASFNLLPYNHPIRLVEQAAMLDILSGGRFELGAARSNNPYTLEGFGVDPAMTRQYRDEYLRIFGKAFTNEWFEHKSEYYDIPERRISPWDPKRRPPPVHISTTSLESHEEAGAAGAGAMSGLSILGWDHVDHCLAAYEKGTARAEPVVGSITSRFATFSVGVCCLADRKAAREMTRENTLRFIQVIMGWMSRLGQTAKGYEYMQRIEELRDRATDLDFLIDSAPYIMAGNPDDLIAKARRLYDAGVDDVVWRIDGLGHENNKATIEMIGKHVIPELHAWPDRRAPQRYGADL